MMFWVLSLRWCWVFHIARKLISGLWAVSLLSCGQAAQLVDVACSHSLQDNQNWILTPYARRRLCPLPKWFGSSLDGICFRIDGRIRGPCQPSMPTIAYHWAVSVSDLGAKFAGSNSGHHWGLSVSTSVDLTEHMDADGTSLWWNPFWPFFVQVPLDDKWQVCPTVFHSGQKMCWHYHDNIWKSLLCIPFESRIAGRAAVPRNWGTALSRTWATFASFGGLLGAHAKISAVRNQKITSCWGC